MLGEHDDIVSAYAEPASGPGWGNAPVWVVVKSRLDGRLRLECLQPDEQSSEIMMLYRVSSVAHSEMTGAVRRHLEGQR